MSDDDLQQLVPVLTATDIRAQAAFWKRLGFAERADHGDYLILGTDGGVEVHLSRWDEHDPRRTAGTLYVRVADAGELYARLRDELEADGLLFLAPAAGLTPALTTDLRALEDSGKEHIRLHQVEDKPWGQRQFAVVDPAGWLLQVGSPTPAS